MKANYGGIVDGGRAAFAVGFCAGTRETEREREREREFVCLFVWFLNVLVNY